MPKSIFNLFNTGLFIFGMSLYSIVSEYYPGPKPIETKPYLPLAKQVEPFDVTPARARLYNPGYDPQHKKELENESEEDKIVRQQLISGEGIVTLVNAINSDQDLNRSLKYISDDFLNTIPDYTIQLLPALKRASLERVIKTFNEIDWQSWSNSQDTTPAHNFVRELSTINKELTMYLNTSSILLSKLYLITKNGDVLDLPKTMQELRIKETSNIMPSVIIEPSFVALFERERGKRVADYIRANQEELMKSVGLIFSLAPQYVTPDVAKEVSQIISRVSKESTPRSRAIVLAREDQEQVLSSFARIDGRSRVSLARLYAVASVDALESKDLYLGYSMLDKSLSIRPGLACQKYIENFLDSMGLDRFRFIRSQKKTKPEAAKLKRESFNLPLAFLFGLFFVVLVFIFVVNRLLIKLHKEKPVAELPALSAVEPSSVAQQPSPQPPLQQQAVPLGQ